MTTTIATYVGNGAQTDFAFSFDYLRQEFVKVQVDGSEVAFTFHTPQTVKIIPAPASGKVIIIRRETDRARLVTFVDGSVLLAGDLNVAQLQAIHIAAEALDAASGSLLIDQTGSYTAGFRRLADLGNPTNSRDAVTKEWAETSQTATLGQAITAKTAAEAAKTAAETAQAAAVTARTAAETARTQAQTSATNAATSATNAATSATTATTQATNATTARTGAETARTGAETARTGAEAALTTIQTFGATPQNRTITTNNGILGGGDLTANRTLTLNYANQATAEAGTDITQPVHSLRVAQAIKAQLNAVGTPPMYVPRAWINFHSIPTAGTYTRAGTTVTVTMTAHGMTTGMQALLDFTTGTATDGLYTVTVVDANTFTIVDTVSGATSGAVTRNMFIRASGNIASVAYLGAGSYTVTFTTAMPDASYAVMPSYGGPSAGGDQRSHVFVNGPQSATVCPIGCIFANVTYVNQHQITLVFLR